ncbi:MAG: hypothetical protein MUC31_06630, partial [Bacteroidales bacterium]|nr:hypothetical protein [Bacteroidales bacterium]
MEAKKIILWLYYCSIGLMLAALPFSNYLMSLSQFGMVMVFILHGIKKQEVDEFFSTHKTATALIFLIPAGLGWVFKSLGRKFREFFHRDNAPAWIFASIYLLHLLGLFFTTDFNFALKDLRIKLPVLLMPLLLSTTCVVDRKAFRFLMYVFVAAVLTGTLISTYLYFTTEFTDSRDLSRYISHIRFSLLIDMAIFILAYMVVKKGEIPKWPRVALAVIALWMLAFQFMVAFMTGLVIFFITAAILVFYMVLNKQGVLFKILIISGLVLIFFAAGMYIRNIGRDVRHIDPVDFSSLERTTILGNPYWHDLSNPQIENGKYVWLYVATDELRQAWNQRSQYEFDGKDKA